MVAPNRKLVNILFSFNINNPKESSTSMTINIEVNMLRDHSISLSTNSFRVLSTHSYISFIEYAEHVKAITNNTI